MDGIRSKIRKDLTEGDLEHRTLVEQNLFEIIGTYSIAEKFSIKNKTLHCVVLYCINGVVIAALCTATFFMVYCASPNLDITRNVNMPIKFSSEAYFFKHEVL